MLQPEKLFANFFNTISITPLRLYNFATDAVTRFKNVNPNGVFTASMAAIIAAKAPLAAGLSIIDTSLGIQKGKTQTTMEVKNAFSDYMSEFESEIAHAVGGYKSVGYIAFYPHGLSEYSSISKTQMPILVKRINTLATAHATELGKPYTAQLQGFEGQWQNAADEQTTVKSTISDGRADRDNIRHHVEVALLTAIHLVATQFPGDVAKCMSFFDFGLLSRVSHQAQPVVAPPSLP